MESSPRAGDFGLDWSGDFADFRDFPVATDRAKQSGGRGNLLLWEFWAFGLHGTERPQSQEGTAGWRRGENAGKCLSIAQSGVLQVPPWVENGAVSRGFDGDPPIWL